MSDVDLENRVRALEVNLATMEASFEQRLEAGAKTFETQRRMLEDVRHDVAPKKVSYVALAGLMLSALLAGGGMVWALSAMMEKRPTRTEMNEKFDQVETKVEHEVSRVRSEQAELRDEVTKMRTTMVDDLREIKAAVRKPRER